jgi:hypothetical protein
MDQLFTLPQNPWVDLVASIVNIVLFVYNLTQRQKLVNLQTADTIIRTLTDQLSARDVLAQEASREITHLKGQLHTLTLEITRLRGNVEAYNSQKLMETPGTVVH